MSQFQKFLWPFFLLWNAAALAQDARIPYRQLYYAQKAGADLNAIHTNLATVLTIQSVLTNVPIAAVALYLDSHQGRIPIALDGTGVFRLPLRDDLLAENPWIVANQPRGTMKLSWKVGVIPGTLSLKNSYRRLLGPVKESEEVEQRMRLFFPGSPMIVMDGLRLIFPPSARSAFVMIDTQGSHRRIQASAQGELIIPLTDDLLQENPPVTFSELPAAVAIVTHPSGS